MERKENKIVTEGQDDGRMCVCGGDEEKAEIRATRCQVADEIFGSVLGCSSLSDLWHDEKKHRQTLSEGSIFRR